jgi:N-acetylglucosaminyldiphosphoundecaprenol N-acetyl-beta-D-mannosaminyltransferase
MQEEERISSADQETFGPRVALLGCEINALSLDQTIDAVAAIVRRGVPVQHCVVNAAKLVAMRDDPELRRIVLECPVVNADGQAVVWAARLLGAPLPERVAGIDLFYALLKWAADAGHPVYFLGATDQVLRQAIARAIYRFPGLIVAGSQHGFFTAADEDAVVDRIRASGARLLFVGMPSPRKEYWLARRLGQLRVPFAMGVGGSFDVLAEKVSRAPDWMQRLGLEWLHRFAQEPRRMWRRYLVGNMRFVLMVQQERKSRKRR